MCSICKKFKKGSITTDEAREELEEQMEFLSEEHVEEIEQIANKTRTSRRYVDESY